MVKGASWFVGDLLCHDQYILKSLRKRNEQVIAVWRHFKAECQSSSPKFNKLESFGAMYNDPKHKMTSTIMVWLDKN